MMALTGDGLYPLWTVTSICLVLSMVFMVIMLYLYRNKKKTPLIGAIIFLPAIIMIFLTIFFVSKEGSSQEPDFSGALNSMLTLDVEDHDDVVVPAITKDMVAQGAVIPVKMGDDTVECVVHPTGSPAVEKRFDLYTMTMQSSGVLDVECPNIQRYKIEVVNTVD